MRLAVGLFALLLSINCPAWAEDGPAVEWSAEGNRVEIRQPFGGSDIVVSTSSRMAGAIDSLTWSGREFVNTYDHGRELQSAASFDDYGECLNPTEAGSDADGTGETSSSRLNQVQTGRSWLQTWSQMAFWLAPGTTSAGCSKGPGPYDTVLSDYALMKRVTIGAHGVANAIEYRATFSVPRPHGSATFEVATAYMPAGFSRFWTYEPAPRKLSPLTDGPGEQNLPVILATEDGSHAMGVYSAGLPQPAFPNQGYGRWSFAHLPESGNATVKWNCVFREANLSPGDHTFTCYVLIGTLQDVQAGMTALQAALDGRQTAAARQAPRHDTAAPQAETSPSQDRSKAEPDRGVTLFVGTEPNCNAGILTTDPRFGGCATMPIGSTLASRSASSGPALYASLADGPSAGVVTSNPGHLNAPTKPIGFLLPRGSEGTPVYVGTVSGCNAGVASTNPTHLNCSGSFLGVALR